MKNVHAFGAPISPADYTGRKAIIETSCGRLSNGRFLSSSIVGGPMIGKTSLLHFISSIEADSYYSDEKPLRIYYDAGLLGAQSTAYEFWRGVLREILSHPQSIDFQGMLKDKINLAATHELDEYDLEDVFDAFAKSGKPISNSRSLDYG